MKDWISVGETEVAPSAVGWEQKENEKMCWSGSSLPLLEVASAVQMHYLRLTQWSRARALETGLGLGHGSPTSCLGPLRPVLYPLSPFPCP